MKEECQGLVAELQALLDTKQMLDAEIAIYRKMLEGEESRVGLRQMVEQVVKTHSLQVSCSSLLLCAQLCNACFLSSNKRIPTRPVM